MKRRKEYIKYINEEHEGVVIRWKVNNQKSEETRREKKKKWREIEDV
jgi:uncharacterized C2H2 Zn-finger protein